MASHVPLVPLSELAPDTLMEVQAPLPDGIESLLLWRDADGRVQAFLNACPHAGRRLDWAPGQFLRSREGLLVCAVHGASFALEDGHCVAGPCRGQGLVRVPVQVRDGAVWLDRTAQVSSSS